MRIIVLGAGGHAKVILDIIHKQKEFDIQEIFFLDDGIKKGTILNGYEVKGGLSLINQYKKEAKFVIAIGDNNIRRKIAESYSLNYMSLIHPQAIIGNDVVIGEGTVIMGGAVINSGTRIGQHCIINSGCTVDHDNIIKDFVHISPGAHLGGMVEIGYTSWIGIGCSIKNNITITSDVTIGAGGVVIHNIEHSGTYVGIPVKMLHSNENIKTL